MVIMYYTFVELALKVGSFELVIKNIYLKKVSYNFSFKRFNIKFSKRGYEFYPCWTIFF